MTFCGAGRFCSCMSDALQCCRWVGVGLRLVSRCFCILPERLGSPRFITDTFHIEPSRPPVGFNSWAHWWELGIAERPALVGCIAVSTTASPTAKATCIRLMFMALYGHTWAGFLPPVTMRLIPSSLRLDQISRTVLAGSQRSLGCGVFRGYDLRTWRLIADVDA